MSVRVDPCSLTPREKDILELAREGLTNNQIGERLGVSGNYVKRTFSGINQKLFTSNRTEAVIEAIRRNLICLVSIE